MSVPEPVSHARMQAILGGTNAMTSDAFYNEYRPRRRVAVNPFWIDESSVSNREFATFVAATGHRTLAEIAPEPANYPGMDPARAEPGSLVFQRTTRPVPLDNSANWWALVAGADWPHPTGPDSDIDGLDDHPVVQVAFDDAAAYAAWAGEAMPTEAEWELAARGGLEHAEYTWGDQLSPGGQVMANYWQGLFPLPTSALTAVIGRRLSAAFRPTAMVSMT
jgi:formylglycine-generating enzyme